MDERFTSYAPERDIYQLLQVDPRADTATIVAACRRLARHYHPDYNASPRATEEMQVVNSVRAVMTDPRARARYDRSRERWVARQAVARWPHARHAPAEPQPPRAAAPSEPVPDPAPGRGPYQAEIPESVRAIVARAVDDPNDRPATLGERLDLALTPRMRRVGVTLRAVAVGVRAGLGALAPTRCAACRAVIGTRESRCQTCGVRLLETTARQ